MTYRLADGRRSVRRLERPLEQGSKIMPSALHARHSGTTPSMLPLGRPAIGRQSNPELAPYCVPRSGAFFCIFSAGRCPAPDKASAGPLPRGVPCRRCVTTKYCRSCSHEEAVRDCLPRREDAYIHDSDWRWLPRSFGTLPSDTRLLGCLFLDFLWTRCLGTQIRAHGEAPPAQHEASPVPRGTSDGRDAPSPVNNLSSQLS
jgi:hypothetical protein